MSVFTRSFLILWTCLLASISPVLADVNPPVLTNPSACGLDLFITEAGCGPANEFQVNVATAPGTSLGNDVYLKELRFIIEHEWAADLDIFLKSPAGVIVEISTDNGDAFDHYGNPNDGTCSQFTSIIAHAALGACNLPDITEGDAPFIGSYLPEGNFSNFDDGSSPIGLWTLMICDDGASNLGHLQFVELVFESTACVAPSEVAVLHEDSTSVLLDWVTGSNCNDVVIEFGPTGFVPGTAGAAGINGTVSLGSCPPFLLMGLSPTTSYDIYLRENCGAGNYSDNACVVQAMTTCSPPPATIVEDFNSQQVCQPICGVTCPITGFWRNASNDNFDWLVNSDTTLTANTGPAGDNPGGGNYVYLEASGTACRNGRRAVLVSNCVQVVANPDSCDMSFDYNFFGVHIGGMSLEVSTNGGATWSVLWNGTGNKGRVWHKKFIDLDAYHGMTVQFRFVGRGGNGQFADLALDNIAFYGSVDLGFPDYVYYLDADGDGYGNPDLYIGSCQPAAFPNYVDNDDDCNDQDFYQNPGQPEYLCDGFDSNCNGNDDEYFVAPVTTQGSTICSGANGFAVAFPANFGQISWYDAPTGGNLVAVGDTIFPDPMLLVNNGLDTLHLQYFAEEVTGTGCVSNERTSAAITILPSPNLSTNDVPGACAGKLFDLTTINISDASGLNGNLSYFDQLPFSPGDEVGPVVMPMVTTNFYIVSEAASGCRDTLTVTYFVQSGPVAHIPDTPTLCRNSSKTISVTDIGNGAAPFQFAWNTGAATDSIQIFSDNNLGTENTYAVTITDVNGCYSSDTLTVTTIDNIDQLITSSTPVTVCNGSDGSISVTPLGGNAPFTYEWAGGTVNNQTGGLVVNDLAQGSYGFTVTDSSPEQCRAVVPVVVVNGPAASVEVSSVQHVACHGGNNGCISLDVIGGPNTTITWSNFMTGANICDLTAGNYTATVTEGSCENIISIPVFEPELLTTTLDIEQVSCFGGNNGQISASVFGGTTPISFLWDNGSTEAILENLAAGFYGLTVTDANNCEVLLPQIPVNQPAQLSLSSIDAQQPTCFGLSNGSINVAAAGGASPYSYSWSNGGFGTGLSNIDAGSYTVHIRDNNGCEISQTIILAQPTLLDVYADEVHPPNCAGQNTGFITTEVAGGTGGYYFLWENGATTPDLFSIGNGTYAVTVTDDNGCTDAAVFGPIASPELLNIGINKTDPPCNGRDEGSVQAFVIGGGLPPYTYNWSTDDSGPELFNLPYGPYTVTVSDANGCESVLSTVLDSIQVLALGYEMFPPLCNGQTGQLALTVAGGTEPYQVVWSDGQTGLVASNLLAQNHAATVTDATGCSNSLGIIPLMEPTALTISLENLDGIGCFGENQGAIDIAVNGGTVPYQYHWSHGATTQDLASLFEGNYHVTVTDDNGCTIELNNLLVASPAPLGATASLGIPVNACQSVQVDEVCVSVTGGILPYQFAWDAGDTTNCIFNPPSGDYHVTITDAAGCTLEFMSIKVPEQYTAVSTQQVPTGQEVVCFGDTTGQVAVAIQGGVAPYQFNWSNGYFGQTSAQFLTNEALPVGNYRVTITDNTGCTAVSTAMPITTYGQVTPTIMNSQVQHVRCKFGNDGAVPLNVIGGLGPYTFYWENGFGDSISNAQHIDGLMAGMYLVTVTDQIGCTGDAATLVLEPDTELILNTPIIDHIACFGEETGSILAMPSGGDTPYVYQWSNMAFTQGIENLPSGQYSLTVVDGNGCQRIANYAVLGPDAPISVNVLDSAGVSCFGASDGFIDILVLGGTAGYNFNWNNFSTEEDLTNAPAGDYLLSIFDSEGCHFTANFELGTPTPVDVAMMASPQTQLNPPNGTASVSPSGGTPPYQYQWTNGMTDSLLTGLPSGSYGVTVQDANLCETIRWVFVDLALDVTENQALKGFKLYPNPTSGDVEICCIGKWAQDMELRIFNQLGQLVLVKIVETTGTSSIAIDLNQQPSGMYQVVGIGQEGVVFEGKILVER